MNSGIRLFNGNGENALKRGNWRWAVLAGAGLMGLHAGTPVLAADDATGTPQSATAGSAADQTGGVGNKPEGTRPTEETKPADKTAAPADTRDWTLKLGTDYYAGRSNLPGFHRYSDGFWAAGSGPAYPSVVYMHSTRGDGSEFKASVGLGELYSGPNVTVKQPVEGWYKTPLGKTNLTVGKFWVPFALEEWEYETKWGVQLDRQAGKVSLIGSANYDSNTHKSIGYFRAGRNWGKNLNVGLSLAGGQGTNFGAVQNRGIALDGTYTSHGWQLMSENLIFSRHSGERFNFDFAKLSYQNLGKLKPFVSAYSWRDQTGAFGNFHSQGVGAAYQIRPELAIEGGVARTPAKTVNWIQLHVTVER